MRFTRRRLTLGGLGRVKPLLQRLYMLLLHVFDMHTAWGNRNKIFLYAFIVYSNLRNFELFSSLKGLYLINNCFEISFNCHRFPKLVVYFKILLRSVFPFYWPTNWTVCTRHQLISCFIKILYRLQTSLPKERYLSIRRYQYKTRCSYCWDAHAT